MIKRWMEPIAVAILIVTAPSMTNLERGLAASVLITIGLVMYLRKIN